MLTLIVTTSAGKVEYRLDLPVNDKIELHYDECSYCDKVPVRRESVHVNNRQERCFCSMAHRKRHSVKGLAFVTA